MKTPLHSITAVSALIALIPTLAFADIVVNNNTSSPVTGYTGNSPCSSSLLGDSGILKPKGSITIPQMGINLYCSFGACKAEVFTSKDCSGRSIATVTVEKKRGVTSINNHNVDDYVVVGSGDSVSIEGGPSLFKRWLGSIFG